MLHGHINSKIAAGHQIELLPSINILWGVNLWNLLSLPLTFPSSTQQEARHYLYSLLLICPGESGRLVSQGSRNGPLLVPFSFSVLVFCFALHFTLGSQNKALLLSGSWLYRLLEGEDRQTILLLICLCSLVLHSGLCSLMLLQQPPLSF